MKRGMKRSRSCLDLTQLEADAVGSTNSSNNPTATGSAVGANDRLRYRSLSGGSLAKGTSKRVKLLTKVRKANQEPAEYSLVFNCRKAIAATPEEHPNEDLNEVVSRLAIAH